MFVIKKLTTIGLVMILLSPVSFASLDKPIENSDDNQAQHNHTISYFLSGDHYGNSPPIPSKSNPIPSATSHPVNQIDKNDISLKDKIPNFQQIPGHICQDEKTFDECKLLNACIKVKAGRVRIVPSRDKKIHIIIKGQEDYIKNLTATVKLSRFKFKDKNPLDAAKNNATIYECILEIPSLIPLKINTQGGKTSVNLWHGDMTIKASASASVSLKDIFGSVNLMANGQSCVAIDGLADNLTATLKGSAKMKSKNVFENLANRAQSKTYGYGNISEMKMVLSNQASVKFDQVHIYRFYCQAADNSTIDGKGIFSNIDALATQEAKISIKKQSNDSDCMDMYAKSSGNSVINTDIGATCGYLYAYDNSRIVTGTIECIETDKKTDKKLDKAITDTKKR